MKKKILSLLGIAFVLIFLVNGCAKKEEQDTKLLIGAAASLQNVMEEVILLYKEYDGNTEISLTFAGSGALLQQIEEGAPIDVFIAAAQKQMDTLAEEELILKSTRVNLMENKIVLIVPKENKYEIKQFTDIVKVPFIALGDPDMVPVGQYAKEVFESINLWDKVKEKATYGKDVAEVLTWVRSGSADAGVVYATDAISEENILIVAEATEGSYTKAVYPAAVIYGTEEEEKAKSFIEFLQTEEVQKVYMDYGFLPVPEK